MRTNYDLRIAILADDLTCAADGAAPFVSRGLPALIGRGRLPHQSAAVVAVDSGSRSVGRSAAVLRVAELTSTLAHHDVLYKTVDSTLRGHVTAELEACFKASGRKTLVFAPAFPAAGRTTVNGVQLVDGVPVSQSIYGRDPVHPAKHSKLSDLVPACAGKVVLLDAEVQEELDEQIALISKRESILWVGSPGMAMALARRFVPVVDASAGTCTTDGDVLVVVGSANPCSHNQADRIKQVAGVSVLRCPDVRQDNPSNVLRRIASDAVDALNAANFGALIATGGDTMDAILDQLGVHDFEILQELDPGFPLGRAKLHNGRELLLAMKAGGFGDADALLRAVAKLRGHAS